ncbi:hypothetical protein SADUNF_Sadunf10G0051100 [Salix dunnii]|uniref:Uncharacterized protein n=1 Tax=Salix dunnii TaxID=1413687 RepID=A0A835JR28_9ROSI|nr:hypothetical protein SADUNF_Sadunf10G0051100 [Salix dunnii]
MLEDFNNSKRLITRDIIISGVNTFSHDVNSLARRDKRSLLGSMADLGRLTKMMRTRKNPRLKRKLIRMHNHSVVPEL